VLAPVLVWLEVVRLGRVLAHGDGLTYYLPVHALAARTWRDGAVPGWDPFSFAGSPLLATSQVGAFYPPNLVHLLLPAATAHTLLVVLAVAVAGLGAALLARRLTGDVVAAAVAGLAFGSSGFLLGHLNHLSIIATAAWLPWAVLGLEHLLARPRPVRVLAAGAPVAAAALAGHPQLLLVVAAVVALWGGCLSASRRSPVPLALAGLALGTGVALAAVQLLPVLLHLGGSDRSSLGFGEAMSWSFSPSHALLLVFPHLFGSQGGSGPFTAPYGGEWSLTELSGYVGAAALVLAVAGLPPARRARRLLPVAVVGVVAGLVALGDSTPVGRLLHALPVLGQLRSWGRATVAVDLAVAVLAAYGTARLRGGVPEPVARERLPAGAPTPSRAGRTGPPPAPDAAGRVRAGALGARRAVLVGAGLVVVLAGAAVLSPHRAEGAHGWWAIALPLGAVAAVVAATHMPRAALSAVVVGVVAADMLLSFGWWHRWREQSPTTSQVAAVLDPDVAPRWGRVPDAPGGVDRVAFSFAEPLRALPDAPRATSAKRIRTVGGYDPLAPGAYLEVAGVDYRGAVDPGSRLLAPGSHVADLRGRRRPRGQGPPGGPARGVPRRGGPGDHLRARRCRRPRRGAVRPDHHRPRRGLRAVPRRHRPRASRSRRCGPAGTVVGHRRGRRRSAGRARGERGLGPGLVGDRGRPGGPGRAGRRRGAGRPGARRPLGRLAGAPAPGPARRRGHLDRRPRSPRRRQRQDSNQIRSSWKGFDVSTAAHSGYQYVSAATASAPTAASAAARARGARSTTMARPTAAKGTAGSM
jgi:hypothetical protein